MTALIAGFAAGVAGAADDEGFVSLFNGRDLTGWEGDASLWTVEDGAITGQTREGQDPPFNKFLIWRGGAPKNFELRLRIWQKGNNSGIQYRSRELKEVGPFSVGGYQCDVHPNPPYNGMLYEERGRGIVAMRGQKILLDEKGGKWIIGSTGPVEEVKNDEWHEFTVIARGNHLIHKIDGKTALEVIDHDPQKRALEGIIALQVHRGPPMKVRVKDVRLKTLPDGGLLSPADTPLPPGAKKVEPPKPPAKKRPKK
jgi:hypothetical protein